MPIFREYFQKYGAIVFMSITFWGLFTGICILDLNSFLLLIIPLSQYLLFIWLQIEHILKTPIILGKITLRFFSLGDTNQISIKFSICALFELLIILIMGIESLFHPQLVEIYFVLYIIPIGLLAIFSLYFSMHSIFANSNIEIQEQNSLIRIDLSRNSQKLIHKIFIFVVLFESIIWIGFSILAHFNIFSFSLYLPGSSEFLNVSYILFFIIFINLIIPVELLLYVHLTILKKLATSIKNLSQETQYVLKKNLQNYLIFPRFLKA